MMRLAMARELGATHTINPGKVDATAEIRAITSYGLNFALDTTGISSVIRSAVLAPMGACGILGASAMGTVINLDEVHFMSGGSCQRIRPSTSFSITTRPINSRRSALG